MERRANAVGQAADRDPTGVSRDLTVDATDRSVFRPEAGSSRCERCIERLKSELLVDISHEFRTPLSLILGSLQDLEDGVFGDLDPPALHQVVLARRNTESVLDLVAQLLDAARLDAGRLELHVGRGDLTSFLRLLVERFQPHAERRMITLSFDGPDSVELWFDPVQLDKVFTNLVSNALKFTPSGDTVRVSLETPEEGLQRDSEQVADRVTVRVADDGPGIAPDQLPRIFERFYRGESPASPYAAGAGLGLSLARDLTELHGGTLTVEGVEGEGSTFVVRLPLGCDHFGTGQLAEEPGARRPPAEGSDEPADTDGEEACRGLTADRDSPLVLVVDDHPGMRSYLRRHLADRYRIEEAADGAEALSRARRSLPDLVVSDIMMPGMDGNALCRELKRDPELDFVPVILLTAKAASKSKVAGLSLGADDYLTKPFVVAELRARIDNLIASRRRLRERFDRSRSSPTDAGLPLAPGVRGTTADRVFLAGVRRAVEEQLDDQEFNVDVLAGGLAIDRTHLFRRLRELTGFTPSALICELRLERAAGLLASGDSKVGEIAWEVGFKDLSHFTRRFRSRYGMTPMAFRVKPATWRPKPATWRP